MDCFKSMHFSELITKNFGGQNANFRENREERSAKSVEEICKDLMKKQVAAEEKKTFQLFDQMKIEK